MNNLYEKLSEHSISKICAPEAGDRYSIFNAKRGTIRTAGGREEGLREEQMRGLKATLDQTRKGQIWVRRKEGASQTSAT